MELKRVRGNIKKAESRKNIPTGSEFVNIDFKHFKLFSLHTFLYL